MKAITLARVLAVCVSLAACNVQDSDYIPYGLKGMNAHVYDPQRSETYLAGFAAGGYLSRNDVRSRCAALASAEAGRRRLKEWSYVCCTVTSSSSCETKVR
jgi:hypothetical protein